MRLAFAAIVLAMLPAVLDQTILATALPTIAADLGSLTDVSWVVTAYVVAAAATTPLWGKLGDRHGRKRLLEIALAWLPRRLRRCAGSRRTSHSSSSLRAVQGVAAGGLMTLAMAAVGDLVVAARARPLPGLHRRDVRRRDRGRPAVGGLLVQHAELALGVLRQPAARRSPRWPALQLRLPARTDERPAPAARRRSAPRCSPARPPRSCSSASGAATATRGTRRRSSR